MIWGVLILVALTAGLGLILKRFNQDGFGTNLGNRNIERWGIDKKREYHD